MKSTLFKTDITKLDTYKEVQAVKSGLSKTEHLISRTRRELTGTKEKLRRSEGALKAAYHNEDTSYGEIQNLTSDVEDCQKAIPELHKQMEQHMQRSHELKRQHETSSEAFLKEACPVVDELATQMNEAIDRINQINERLIELSEQAKNTPLIVPALRDARDFNGNTFESGLTKVTSGFKDQYEKWKKRGNHG